MMTLSVGQKNNNENPKMKTTKQECGYLAYIQQHKQMMDSLKEQGCSATEQELLAVPREHQHKYLTDENLAEHENAV